MPKDLRRVGFIHRFKPDTKNDVDKSLRDSGIEQSVKSDAQFIKNLKRR